MILKEIAPQSGSSFELKTGDLLKVLDPMGEQVSDLFCFAADNPKDVLSSGKSIDYNDTILFTKGHILYASSGKAMLEIVEDSCGRHDFLITPCSLQMFQMVAKNSEYHPSCLENIETALAAYPFDKALIGTTFNIFMNVSWDNEGRIKIKAPLSKPQDSITLKAKMDLVVVLTACSDEGTNNHVCKPIAYEIRKASDIL